MNDQDREQRDRLIEALANLSGGIESLRADMEWMKVEFRAIHAAINGDSTGASVGLAEKTRDNESRIRDLAKRMDKRDAATWGVVAVIVPTALRVAWEWIKPGK